jgi:ribose 5-phosphate isomerase B
MLVRVFDIWYSSNRYAESSCTDYLSVAQHGDRLWQMADTSIAAASDHAGYGLKLTILEGLIAFGLNVLDLGVDGTESDEYLDAGCAPARVSRDDEVRRGVLICGSGIGISIGIAAIRYAEVLAALVNDALSARMARQYNNANVRCFGRRMIGVDVARDCLQILLETDFEGGRHQRRVDKLSLPQ